MADIEEAAAKKLKSRIRKFKKTTKDEEEKQKFFKQLGVMIAIALPNKNPDKQDDRITLIANPEGKLLYAFYDYEENEGQDAASIDIGEKDLKVLAQAFEDFKIELDN
jgi:hypothetical protein